MLDLCYPRFAPLRMDHVFETYGFSLRKKHGAFGKQLPLISTELPSEVQDTNTQELLLDFDLICQSGEELAATTRSLQSRRWI